MNELSNHFSMLELDVGDADATDAVNCKRRDSGKSVGEENLLKNANGDQETSESDPGEYRMPLVWIDLEMTGLDTEVDRILEIACVITDGDLTKTIDGPDLVIHQTKECLDKMGEWCQIHHSASGLTEKVLQSSITEQEAEKQEFRVCIEKIAIVAIFGGTMRLADKQSDWGNFRCVQVVEFVKRHVGTYTPLIAGNSIYTDLLFLKKLNQVRKYMPDLAGLFSHILVDVSSVKALCVRWYPRDKRKAPQKGNKHRAMDDIKESIAELKFYKDHIFKHKSKR